MRECALLFIIRYHTEKFTLHSNSIVVRDENLRCGLFVLKLVWSSEWNFRNKIMLTVRKCASLVTLHLSNGPGMEK